MADNGRLHNPFLGTQSARSPADMLPQNRAAEQLSARLYARASPRGGRLRQSPGQLPTISLLPSTARQGSTAMVPRPPPPRKVKGVVKTSLPARTLAPLADTMRSKKRTKKAESTLLSQSAPPVPPAKEADYAQRPEQEEKKTRTTLLQQAREFKTFMETLEGQNNEELKKTVNGESFMYLQPVDGNVYKFQAVDYQSIDANNYYTLSESGVTHFVGGDAQFTSLEQYEREYYLYSMVTEIPFFKKYRIWKSFTEWKKNVTACKVAHCKVQLEEHLFILHPLLRKSLMQLRELCYKVSVYKLFSVSTDSTYSLDEFCRLQEEQKMEIIHHLQQFSEEVSQLVQSACESALRQFLDDNGFTAETNDEGMQALEGDFGDLDPHMYEMAMGSEMMESQVEEEDDDAPREITFTERAAMRTQCRKLTKYVRLADFFVVDAFLSLALGSTENFLTSIQKASAQVAAPASSEKTSGHNQAPLFEVEYIFQDPGAGHVVGELHFKPQEEEFKVNVESVIFDALKVVTSPARLLTHPSFKPFVQPSIDEYGPLGEGVDLEMMIVEDAYFQAMVEAIDEHLADAFEKAENYAQLFVPYKQKFIENNTFLATCKTETYLDSEISQLKGLIEKYEEQVQDFQSIPDLQDVGIIRVNSESLNGVFKPSPSDCLRGLHKLVPAITVTHCDKLLEELSTAKDKVAAVPYNVDEFATLINDLKETSGNVNVYDERYMAVTDLYNLCDEFKIPVNDEEKSKSVMLTQTKSTLVMSMQLSEESVEENTTKFAKDLETDIPKLRARVEKIRQELMHSQISNPESTAEEVIKYLHTARDKLTEEMEMSEKFGRYQSILKLPIADYEDIDEVKLDMNLKIKLWEGLESWSKQTEAWTGTPFTELDAPSIEKTIAGYYKICSQAERGLEGNMVVPKLKGMVEEFRGTMPVVVDLRCPDLKERHWEAIHDAVGFEIHGVEGLTLGNLIERQVASSADVVNTLATEAIQEGVLEVMLTKVADSWAEAEFAVNNYKEQKDVYVLGGVDDVIANLDDSLVSINTIFGSRYVGPIRDKVEKWQKQLLLFSDTLDEWLNCQKNWMYLETIFSAPDIQRQLPNESKQFFNVDSSWKDIMKRCFDNPNCLKCGTVPGLLDTFKKHNITLDQVQKHLEEYLETKRMAFPRFYFLSNDELLEILAQTKDPQAVQPHLRKCFDCLIRLDFGDVPGSIDILAMMSGEGEKVPLGRNLKARGNVEDWLTSVQENMQKSIHRFMKACLLDYDETPRREWVLNHPGQCVASVAQMAWARGCEECLLAEDSPSAWKKWYDLNVFQLSELTEHIRGSITKLQRKVIVALITTDVHARDVVEEMMEAGVDNITNFTWQQQLRYYWDKDIDDVLVRQSNCAVNYGYEYMGATSRLVITPLTDRCWMTITGSFDLKLGAAPAGPAGTGKTESSKDLAKAIAIQCIVFNCSDQIDYKMMGKLFTGLSQCGCWTCLDEFNRIDIEVLSVIAQQLTILREGRRAGKSHIQFEGNNILLQDHHVIVTMNPGYAGRTELPDNLKVCFRPVSMMVPDYGLIAEIMLFAEGFGDAKSLSRKMTKLYKLSSEQLSQQPHYDFGMRAVKSVLVMAGALKRGNPEMDEDILLIRAMRDANLPKFLSDDLPLFHAIVGDLFPGAEVPVTEYGSFQTQMNEEITKLGLQLVPGFIAKVIQLHEMFQVRFGVVQVGPTGGGKTSVYTVLQKTLTSLFEAGDTTSPAYKRVYTECLNPKCIRMGELYGEFNPLTQEWTDGLAPTIMRRHVADESEDKKWTVWDGPIDAIWIESMNTVLDDNMTLCLANGERIKLKVEMRMLFEVMDLEVASPATVSRLGVVFLTPTDLGWMPYIQSWIPNNMPEGASEELKARLLTNFEKLVKPALKYTRKYCKEPIATQDINIAASMCALFKEMFGLDSELGLMKLEGKAQIELLDKIFVFATTWVVGAALRDEDQREFDVWLRDNLPEAGLQGVGMPGAKTIYDFYIKPGDNTFTPWDEIVPKFEYNPSQSYFEMFVPSVDTVRYSFCMERLLRIKKPIFLTGVTGTGKTMMIQNLLEDLSPIPSEGGQGIIPVTIGFSAQTLALVTQLNIESKLEKKRKTLFGAPSGRKIALFIDDVNMPEVEEYGAQPPIELLRQLIDSGGFYDRQKLFWKDIVDVITIACAAPPGGGRNQVTPRFVRQFNVLCVPPASTQSMDLIFSSILNGFLSRFQPDIQKMSRAIVDSTVEVYARISAELLPTPARFHYTFNLRDISKVFQGVLMILPKSCQSTEVMARLWTHETMRVFHDRLINAADKRWFTDLTVELLSRNFSLPWSHDDLFGEGVEPLRFADYLRPGTDPEDRLYEPANSLAKVVGILESYLEDYNTEHTSQMNLVFFGDAVEHINRISRILRQPRGNALLVGVGGSGKQSLTRLATAVAEYELVQIEITRGYGVAEFHESLKEMMIVAGVSGKHVTFLFTDTQIVVESFVEDLNSVLNSGEVANLFPQDENDRIMGDMREVVKAMGIPESRENCEQQFVARVRDRLHMVLCMSPVGDALRVRCRNFPSLINCTTIDWFTAWPKDALSTVATRLLADLELSTEENREALVEMCTEVHLSLAAKADQFYERLMRKVYTTPKSYLDLIASYLSMLKARRADLNTVRSRLKTGVIKLEETNQVVTSLKADLTKLQPVLKQKAIEAAELLKNTAVEQQAASVIKEKVGKDEAVVAKQAAEVSVIQADAQEDLDKALPALAAAVKALDALDKKDITEVKSFAKPPEAVQTTMEAVCVMLEEKPDWDTAKKVLSRSTFLQDLKDYDKDNIPEKTLKKLAKYIKMEGFAIEVVSKVSSAAKSLCMWCHAMDVYAKVAKEVGPKKALLEEMNNKLAVANGTLAQKQAELKAVIDKVDALQKLCDETVAEKQRLADESEQTKNRLIRAEKLTSGLADEYVRWKATVTVMDRGIEDLVGDVFLSAASISYYGAFTGVYREELVDAWYAKIQELQIPCADDYSLVDTMGEPVLIREWQIFGLPTDTVSTDNAIMVKFARRWPLMIDPQGQANKWIRAMEGKSGLCCTKLNNPNMLRELEACIRNGKPMLIEDIQETLDPSLEPVLQKAVYKQGGRTLIRLGDSDVDYDEGFRFYITTNMPNPHYLPEICIKVTVINFTVTVDGLEDQLLGDVVKKERPDIEEKKNNLIVSIAADKKQLKGIEDKILQLLSESKGNILDDEILINTLAESKVTSGVISERLAESEVTEKEINTTRNNYRPVAVRGSIIYFVIADMGLVDPMYQFSLEFFKRLFNKCIDDSEKSPDLAKRLATLIEYQTEMIFINICRSLFEAHKLMFAFLVCSSIMLQRKDISRQEWSLLLKGAGIVDRSLQEVKCPDEDKILEPSWDLLNELENVLGKEIEKEVAETEEGEEEGEEVAEVAEEDIERGPAPFGGICQHISENWDKWHAWMEVDDAHNAPLPAPWEQSLTAFQKMLIVKALREELGNKSISSFVLSNLGQTYVAPPSTSMEELYEQVDCKTPCIFVLSQGADPTNVLLRFAGTMNYSNRLSLISLGQGQGPRAEAMISSANKDGGWVLLQNCHLAKSWMDSLENICFDLVEMDTDPDREGELHKDFRLWLTSFPATYFPVPVLQNSIKLTNEPPKGMRANLLRSFDLQLSDELFNGSKKPKEFKKLLFSLSFFHATMQERRKFGPLGWNIRYEFNDSDMETAIAVLQGFLDEQEHIPWDALQYVTGHINYGGRVTDDWDRRCLMTILHKFYSGFVLEDGYKYSESGTYYCPDETDFAGYKDFLSKLPHDDSPEIFGMHSNANITFMMQETEKMISTILSLQPRDSGAGGGETPDQMVTRVAISMEETLPDILDRDDAGPDTFLINAMGQMDSLATVLGQEIVKFNRLINRMRTTLRDIQKAIKGLVVMSLDLDKMYTSIQNNQVPELWSKVGFASLKPLATWVIDLQFRMTFMRDWLLNGQPLTFALQVFYFPQGFLTGALQNHSRKYAIPINALDFNFKVIDTPVEEIKEAPEDGCIIYGLWMEGAKYSTDSEKVADSEPGEMYYDMPAIIFTPEKDYKRNGEEYCCPVYKTSLRKGVLSTTGISTNFVLGVDLPCERTPEECVLQGTAFLLNLNT